jgi:hypothetical protein
VDGEQGVHFDRKIFNHEFTCESASMHNRSSFMMTWTETMLVNLTGILIRMVGLIETRTQQFVHVMDAEEQRE